MCTFCEGTIISFGLVQDLVLIEVDFMEKKSWYDKEEDILGIQLFEGDYWKSIELPNGIAIGISKDGKIMALEIANAKKIFSGETKKVLQTAAAH